MDPYEVQYLDKQGNVASTSIDGGLRCAQNYARNLVAHDVKGVVLYKRVIELHRIDYNEVKS